MITIKATGDTTIHTAGKYCPEDILVKVPEASSGVEQATPVISINTSGLITATAGNKSATKQLAFQAAKTITPSATSQIAVSSGYYTGGNITVAGDANLVAGNIKSGVSIFGVSGNYVGSGGSGEGSAEYSENEDDILNRTITSYTNDRLTTVGSYAFYSCTKLSEVSFANATNIRNNAFNYCTSLTTADFPKVTSISASAFQNCHKLKTLNMPNLTTTYSCAFNYCSSLTTVNCSNLATIGSFAFQQCYSLSTVSFPNAATISGSAFRSCRTLCSLTVGTNKSTVCTLTASTAFRSTPFAGYSSYFSGTPVIYVPASLLTSYQAATNWTYFSKYMVGI